MCTAWKKLRNPLKDNTWLKCFDVAKPKWMNHLWRRQKDQGRWRGIPVWLWSCQVLIFLEGTVDRNIRWYEIRQTTDRSCSRSPSCHLCQGQSPGWWGRLFEPLLWTVSYNPNLTDLLEDREIRTQMKLDDGDTMEVSDMKPQDHRNTQHNAWKIYAEETAIFIWIKSLQQCHSWNLSYSYCELQLGRTVVGDVNDTHNPDSTKLGCCVKHK